MTSFFDRLVMRWRLWWNLCPTCNSDAPECHTCSTCEGSREFPLSLETKRTYEARHLRRSQ
jgi:hypothetical protein